MYLIHFRGAEVPKWPQATATFAARLAVNLSAMIEPVSTTAASKLRRKLKTKMEKDQQILQIKYVTTNGQKIFLFLHIKFCFGGFGQIFLRQVLGLLRGSRNSPIFVIY
jgi:hypothetical protein